MDTITNKHYRILITHQLCSSVSFNFRFSTYNYSFYTGYIVYEMMHIRLIPQILFSSNFSSFYFFASFVQLVYFSTCRSRCEILFGFYSYAIIHNYNDCIGVWSKGDTCNAWPGRSMG